MMTVRTQVICLPEFGNFAGRNVPSEGNVIVTDWYHYHSHSSLLQTTVEASEKVIEGRKIMH